MLEAATLIPPSLSSDAGGCAVAGGRSGLTYPRADRDDRRALHDHVAHSA